MAKSRIKLSPCKLFKLELAVSIAAPPKRVWTSLINQTAAWWPGDFYSSLGKAKMTIESRVGGRMFEDRGKGGAAGGALWGCVTEFHPNTILAITGHSASRWGGPNAWFLRIEFVPKGKGTRLEIVNDVFGRVDAKHARDLEKGWMTLFGDALKSYAESARSK